MEDIIDIIVTETTNLIEITSQPTDEIIDVNIIDNREDVTLNVTPTVVEININSLTGNFGVNWGEIEGTLSNQTDLQNALNLKADLVDGKVPSSQLPSYVDDVIEVATYSALPTTGEVGKIYVVLDTNLIYRWSGSAYIEIKDSSAVWGAITGTLSNQTDLQNALNAKVPYTGATSNVNLGEYGVTAGYVALDTTPTSTPTGIGTIYWDSANRTANLIDGDGDTTLQIGQEERVLIHNGTGATLTDGQIVYVTGSTGELPSVALADASIESTSAATLGVVTETITNGADGFVTLSGIVHGLNTLAFNEGDLLWLSETAGQYTNVKPISPAHLVLIGYVIKKAGGNGSIFVKIQNTQELAESSDVLFTSLTNNDGLFYEASTDLWKNKSIATVLGYTPANDSLVVHLAGTETITGAKTLTNLTTFYNASSYSDLAKFGGGSNNVYLYTYVDSYGVGIANGAGFTGESIYFNSNQHYIDFSLSSASKMKLVSGGGLEIGYTNLQNTYKLDVNGTANFAGNITGTNITISNSLIAKGGTFNGGASYGGIVTIDGLGSDLLMNRANTSNGSSITLLTNAVEKWNIGLRSAGTTDNFFIYNSNLLSNSLTIDSATSAATFTSSITALKAFFSNSSGDTVELLKGSGPSIKFSKTATTAQDWALAGEGTAFKLYNYTAGTTPFLVTTSGNVGIGTTSPGRKLQINVTPVLGEDEGINVYNGSSNFLFTRTASTYSYRGVAPLSGMIYSEQNISLLSDGGNVTFHTNGGERMRITSGGNVGIGTSSPSYKLEIVGGVGTNQPVRFESTTTNLYTAYRANGIDVGYIGNGTGIAVGGSATDFGINASNNLVFTTTGATERMRITSSGNVGIGTTSPNRALVVSGGNSEQLVLISSTTKSGISLNPSNTTFSPYIGSTGNDIVLETSGGERMRITSGGNVLIGTTSDGGQKLQVNGDIRANNIKNISLNLLGAGTPVSTGLDINGYNGGRTYLLVTSQQWSNGSSTSSAITMIRCGYDGNNMVATLVSSNNLPTETWSQSGGILYVAGGNGYQIKITVINSN